MGGGKMAALATWKGRGKSSDTPPGDSRGPIGREPLKEPKPVTFSGSPLFLGNPGNNRPETVYFR